MLNYWSQMAAQENAQWNTNREMAYNQAMALLTVGKTPSTELLAAAGISSKDAKNLAKAYKPKSSGGGGGGSSSKSSSSGSSNKSSGNDEVYKPSQAVNDMATAYQYEINSEGRLYSEVEDSVKKMVSSGKITKADGAYILSRL